MLKIVPAFTKKELQNMHSRMLKDIESDILAKLADAAKAAVELVRKKQGPNPYEDRTGNLNSSTGFIIARLGKVVYTDFRQSQRGTDKRTGVATGKKIARQHIDRDAEWQIVMVAGMEYASWVQIKHSRDVLASATDELPESIGKALTALKRINYE